MSLVLDSSATLAWVYAEELTVAIRKVFDRVMDAGAWVPSHWRLEMVNVLEMGFVAGGTTRRSGMQRWPIWLCRRSKPTRRQRVRPRALRYIWLSVIV